MGNQVGMLKMRTANKKPQRMPQTFGHTTTTNFFEPSVIFCKKVMPGEHVKIRTTMNIKPRALSMPAEIKLKNNLRAFWVPNFTTHKDWFAYRTNLPYRANGEYKVREEDYYTTNSALVKMFLMNPSLRLVTYTTDTNPESLSQYDMVVTVFNYTRTTINGYLGFDFTRKGRLMYSLLQQLGYEINWQVNVKKTANLPWAQPNNWESETGDRDIHLSMRPILSLCKVMHDWYVPTQYQNRFTNYFESLYESIEDFIDVSTIQGHFGEIMSSLMLTICYDMDRFNGAWQNPQGPNVDTTNIEIKDITIKNSSTTLVTEVGSSNTNLQTPIIETNKTGTEEEGVIKYGSNITDYLLRALNAIQNYTTRNRIAGYRPIDRFLAHFGIHLDYVHTKRSQHIKSATQYMYGNDIVNLAQSSTQEPQKFMVDEKDALGGRGSVMTAKNGIDFEWKADDDGWIIVLSTITVANGYYQGLKNHVLGTDWRQSLYNPEFDNLGTTGINKSELFHSAMIPTTWMGDNVTWGYEPTYMGMKTGWDTLSGDFRIRTKNTGLEAMHTMRMFDEKEGIEGTVSSEFLIADGSEYNRIFDYTGDDVDHFVINAMTVNSGTMPVESVSESLPITDGEGMTTKFEYGGSYMN